MSFLKYLLFVILIIVLYNIFLFILYKILYNLVKKKFPEFIKVCPDCFEEYVDCDYCSKCGTILVPFDEMIDVDEEGEKKKMIDFNEIKLINFLELFEHYEIELDYYWDVSEKINELKKEGYSDEEIQEEFSYELEDDFERDLEYSFKGSYNEFLEFIKEYDVYDDVYITDDIIKEIRLEKNNKFIYIKIIRYYYI